MRRGGPCTAALAWIAPASCAAYGAQRQGKLRWIRWKRNINHPPKARLRRGPCLLKERQAQSQCLLGLQI